MGNSNTSTDTSKASTDTGSFTKSELANVEATLNEINAQNPEAKAQRAISKDGLIRYFVENPVFASKFYNWIKKLAESNQVSMDKALLGALEVLVKDPMQYQLAQFRSRTFEKYEAFLQVSIEQYLGDRDGLQQVQISYQQGVQFFKEVLNAFHSGNNPNERNIEYTAKIIAAGFFNDTSSSISWSDFLYYIKQNINYLTKATKFYFNGKFIERALPLQLPTLDDTSLILNKELLGLFYLSNPFFHSVPKLHLIYSTAKSGTSLNRLTFALKGYDAPTLILVKHTELEDQSRGLERKSYLFGAFSRASWSEELKYQGDSEGYVFSLAPKFKPYYAYKGQGGTNYTYLNTKRIQGSKYKVGLGFGGTEFKNYRLWLDEELETGSYVSPDDTTYEKGFLVDPSVSKFNIEHVEIWGLGDNSTLAGQQEHRQREMDIIESQRKVDKKAFLQSGFDKEMFFGNSFKTSERADQTDFRAEMEKEAAQKSTQ